MIPDLTRACWCKASRSAGNGGECVEIATVDGVAAVRDSKNPIGPALVLKPGAFTAFLSAVKNGQLS